MKVKKSAASTGRPRSFDVEEALEQALLVFWRKGYEGASLSDLTTAMGINRPSLYATFGDKEALFRKVIERYANGPASYVHDALQQPTARAVAEGLLYGALELLSAPHHPHGCLWVQGALACGDAADPIRQELAARRAMGEVAIRQRFEQAKSEGDLPSDANPEALARFITTVNVGMAVQAAGGADREALQQVVDMALQRFPG